MGSPAEEFGPYVVYEQIGLGGMATVHRAETQAGIGGFSKQIALKRMLPSVAADASLVKSFIREARLASHLRHANVAQTYDLGKVGNIYFIAMELVPGRNLREILKHCAMVAGNMPLPIAMNIVNQICDALDYAHNLCDEFGGPLGIIHRDVSPSNIIVSEGGVVKLIDFGIAKATGAGMATMSGTIKGKFSYMAPETLLGHVDARADLFALGVIAYELLTNRPLFQGKDDMTTLTRVKDMRVDPPSRKNAHVPPEIDTIIMTALERDPEQRWQRATALRTALTTETQRLGLIAHNTEVIDWIDWAFRQGEKPNEESVVISIDRIQTPVPRAVPGDFLAAGDSMETLVRPAGSQPMQSQDWKAVTDTATNPRDFEMPTRDERPSAAMAAQQLPHAAHSSQTLPTSPFNVATTPDGPGASIQRVDWDEPVAPQRSSPHVVPRAGSPQQRPSTPPPNRSTVLGSQPPQPTRPSPPMPSQRSSQQHAVTLLGGPGLLPPIGSVPSGAKTQLHMPADAIPVSASAVLDERSLLTATPTSTVESKTNVAEGSRGGASNFLLAVLVLIVAGGAAAVVYFALPYLT